MEALGQLTDDREMQKTCFLEDLEATEGAEDLFRATAGKHTSSAAADGWSGDYDQRTIHRPGGLLMAALLQHAAARGESIAQMCVTLGYS